MEEPRLDAEAILCWVCLVISMAGRPRLALHGAVDSCRDGTVCTVPASLGPKIF